MTQPFCLEIPSLPEPGQITLPGGVQIEHLNLMEIVQPALSPLVPLFDLVDTLVVVFTCIKAIPDALGPPPDPTKLAACIPDLARKMDKLLRLLPQLSLPVLIGQLLKLLIDTVQRAVSELRHLQQQVAQLEGVIARATELEDAALMSVAHCKRSNLEQEAANVGKSLATLGQLIGVINVFSGMIGGPPIPDVPRGSDQPLDAAVVALEELLSALETARKMLPVP